MGSSPSSFQFVGGRVSLDFVNAVRGDGSEGLGRGLQSFPELLEWSRQREILGEDSVRRLARAAERTPEEADAVVARAIALRAVLFGLFTAQRDGRAPPGELVDRFNRELGHALSHQRLQAGPDGCALGWDGSHALDAMLWPVVRCASELLCSEKLPRVKVCAGVHEGRCDWVFLDETKSNTRRWCSMRDCGNVTKQRRFKARRKA